MKTRIVITELNGDWDEAHARETALQVNDLVRPRNAPPTGGLHASVDTMPASNLHQVTETLTTPELSLGDVVLASGGMLCLIDDVLHERDGVVWTSALVLNRDAVSTDEIPFSFTAAREPGGRMRDDAERLPHRWTIQGNENARWAVIRVGR